MVVCGFVYEVADRLTGPYDMDLDYVCSYNDDGGHLRKLRKFDLLPTDYGFIVLDSLAMPL